MMYVHCATAARAAHAATRYLSLSAVRAPLLTAHQFANTNTLRATETLFCVVHHCDVIKHKNKSQ